MGELDDDIARGCLPNGEPIEARCGTGPWSGMPQPEPDPWEEALSSAHLSGVREGYIKALDDVIEIAFRDFEFIETLRDELLQLKSDYLQEVEKPIAKPLAVDDRPVEPLHCHDCRFFECGKDGITKDSLTCDQFEWW